MSSVLNRWITCRDSNYRNQEVYYWNYYHKYWNNVIRLSQKWSNLPTKLKNSSPGLLLIFWFMTSLWIEKALLSCSFVVFLRGEPADDPYSMDRTDYPHNRLYLMTPYDFLKYTQSYQGSELVGGQKKSIGIRCIGISIGKTELISKF